MFERLRAALGAALDAATPPGDPRHVAGQMREAIVEARTSLAAMRKGIAQVEQELTVERRALADAERRGGLAAKIDDRETVQVTDRFATKHRERVAILEQKLVAQQAELALAEREVAEMKEQYVAFERSLPASEAARNVNAAWRDLEAAGVGRAGTDDESRLQAELDRVARQAQADAQLEALKKKMGKR